MIVYNVQCRHVVYCQSSLLQTELLRKVFEEPGQFVQLCASLGSRVIQFSFYSTPVVNETDISPLCQYNYIEFADSIHFS